MNVNENFEIANISGVSCYEQDGTAYLKLEDVARGLGFTQTQNKNGVEYTSIRWETINRYLEEIGFPNKLGKDSYIPENVFYRLAMKAKNETAEKFQALVADDIIPSIRKHGGYIVGQEQMTPQELMAKALVVAQKTLEDREARILNLTAQNKKLANRNEYLTPRADYCDNVLKSTAVTYLSTDIAKEYGWSARKLNKVLHELKIIQKVGKNWHLYSHLDGQGLVEYKETEYYDHIHGMMSSSSNMYWTERGKAYIYNRLKKLGFTPRKEASRKVKEGK